MMLSFLGLGYFLKGEGGSGLKFYIARSSPPSLLAPGLGNEHTNEHPWLGSE